MRNSLLVASALSAFGTLAGADAIYTKNSPVLQVSGKDFSSLIEQSNHTSIVEFYAPWCGHCQSLKPAYEKAAKSLAGLAKVAAVNCDEESNKPFCGQMGIQGFPTLKIVKPGSKKGKPVIEDYQGPRNAKGIVDAVMNKIPNHVKKVQDADLDAWLKEGGRAKAILFTEKGTTGALIKALAVDFLGVIDFATIRDKEKIAVQDYGITKFPTVVLITDKGKEPAMYEGEMKKDSLIKFFAQVAPPNPDPAPKAQKTKAKAKTTASKKGKDASSSSATASAKFSKASTAHKSADFEDYMNKEEFEYIDIELNENNPMGSPLPIVEQKEKPMVVKEAAPDLPLLATAAELESACLAPKSGNCILLLLPLQDGSDKVQPVAAEALTSFAEVAEKHHKRNSNIFPFYGIPADNQAAKALRNELNLKEDAELEVLAINMKRKWWRKYPASGYDVVGAESFVDAIRLGEGAKQKLPADFRSGRKGTSEGAAAPEAEAQPVPEESETVEIASSSPEPAATAEIPVHNEL